MDVRRLVPPLRRLRFSWACVCFTFQIATSTRFLKLRKQFKVRFNSDLIYFFIFFLEAVFFHLFWHYHVSALLTFSWLSAAVCQHLADDPGPFVAFLNILMNVSAIRGLFFLIQSLVCRVRNLWDLKWLHTTAANDCAAAYSRLFNSDWWVGYYRQTFVLTLTC